MSSLTVGVLGPVYPDSFADNVIATLRNKGIPTVALGSAIVRPRSRGARVLADAVQRAAPIQGVAQSSLVKRCRASEVSVVLALESTLLPATVAAMQRQGCLVALWFPDAVVNLDRQLMFLAPYDALFFKEPRLVSHTRNMLGLPTEYLPEACNPLWHVPDDGAAQARTIAVAGNMYGFRLRLLERLLHVGLPLTIYGPPWPPWLPAGAAKPQFTGRYLARADKADVFRGAALVLNNLHPAEIDGVNCRLFEAAGCGAAVLTEERAAVHDCFDASSEVATFSTFDELVDKARWFLDRPAEARSMGDRAAKRAHAEHTYEDRLALLFARLGLKPW